MQQDSANFYIALTKVAPFVLIGVILAVLINYLLIQTMIKVSPNSIGWPFIAGTLDNNQYYPNIFGLIGDFLVWTVLFSAAVPVLKSIFIKGENAA
jgi:hypothetical protein